MIRDEIKKYAIIEFEDGTNKESSIEITPREKYTVKDLYSIINKELLLPIKNKDTFNYRGKSARLIIWWIALKDNDEYNTDEQFLSFIGASIVGNDIIPNVRADESLKWCHIIQKQLKMKTTPVFHNKGKTKYYMLHINKNQ